jgi:DNA replication protein DnaC
MKGYSIVCKYFYDLMDEIKDWEIRSLDIINACKRTEFLIIQEIGLQFDTVNERKVLFQILNYRYENNLPFILTANLPMKEFRKYIDFDGYERIWDRLNKQGKILVFDWESYRLYK